jgi:sulfur transfer complex TusBCD TusB component (DsrH family)
MEEQAVLSSMLDLSTLEERCMSEIENDSFKDLTNAQFSLELLHRAASQGSQEAREAWQRCFSGILRGWLHRHPRKVEACRFDSEEHYLAQAFERFWQTMTERQQLECTALSTALIYLQASLQGVLLDTLRAHAGPRRIASLKSRNAGVLRRKDDMNARQWWERMQQMFPDVRDLRVAYLLFHCNLSPRDIFCFAPQEFRDVQEICRLRARILERILLHSDLIC